MFRKGIPWYRWYEGKVEKGAKEVYTEVTRGGWGTSNAEDKVVKASGNPFYIRLKYKHMLLCICICVCMKWSHATWADSATHKSHRLSNKTSSTWHEKPPLLLLVRAVQVTLKWHRLLLLLLVAFWKLKVIPYCWRDWTLLAQDLEDYGWI